MKKQNKKSVGLRIALPNGSLEEGTMRLFEQANLRIFKDPRKHNARIEDQLFSEVTFMRPQHIPRLVENGTYDIGICGLDCQFESSAHNCVIAELPYGRGNSSGKAKVVLVTSQSNHAKRIEDVERSSILDEYPSILSEYPSLTKSSFRDRNIDVKIEFSYGGTEAHIPRDYKYGVCLTDTGASLVANGLKTIHTFLESYTCLITNQEIWCRSGTKTSDHAKKKSVVALKHLLLGTLAAREQVFLVMNVTTQDKDKLLQQLPALKTPTITPLSGGNYFSVGAVIFKEELNTLIPALLTSGAEDLVEMPISKVIKSW
ncbi:MAG: ATP phosphoribosyltransferase [Candidatus Nomurabacteria bacterium]|nr:ATP phosphoribosyltransferase [Candidatus Nomurabacteria bacterium]